jgi:hypothetical protein
MRISRGCFLTLLFPLQAFAINPPQWEEIAKGEFCDTANVKTDADDVAAYIRHGGAITLYEVDCKGDRIRVHSDTPRYRAVPVEGGGQVVVSDDGFRPVVPGSRDALIENAICGIVTKREEQRSAEEVRAECEKAKKDDFARVFIAKGQLTHDEGICLFEMASGDRPRECDKAAIAAGTNVVEYLHGKGIFLECEDRSVQP